MTQEPKIFPYITRLLQGAEVVWKPLGEVAEIKRGQRVTKQELSNNKQYPVYSGGVKPMGYYDTYNQEANTITIVKYGTAGYVNFITERFWANDVCYCIKPHTILENKYLLYVLKNMQLYINSLATDAIPAHLPAPSLASIQIPLPPLSVQQEIVRILDKFTQLEAELEAELDCRKRQYEYYRNKLLSYEGNEVEWKALGEVGTFIRGNGLQKKDFVETGIGCIHYGQIYTYYGIKASETISYVTEDLAKSLRKASHNDLIIAGVSENIEDVCKCVVWEGEEDICVSGDTFIFKTDQNPHYIGHLLRTDNFLNYKRKNAIGAKVTRLQAGSLPKYTIPLPPLEEQQRIANILDKFDTLVNSISEGLPKEISLRRKQYEYYREKLLSFPKE